MKTFVILFVSCVVGAGYASADDESCPAKWDTLQHTFNLSMALKRAAPFVGGPEEPLQITNFAGESCVNNVGSATFYGIRRVLGGDQDNNLVGLYDANGIIAGVQVRFNKAALSDGWTNNFRYDRVPMYNTETVGSVTYYVLTAYFIRPDRICDKSQSRTPADLKGSRATGDQLLFQNGPDLSSLLMAPDTRDEALELQYSENRCFYGMGNHTFYNVESWQANGCTEITPVFLLQNEKGCLVGFGFAWVGKSVSPLFEQPPDKAVKMIVGEDKVPQCLIDLAAQKRLTTMHFFFTKKVEDCGGLSAAAANMFGR